MYVCVCVCVCVCARTCVFASDSFCMRECALFLYDCECISVSVLASQACAFYMGFCLCDNLCLHASVCMHVCLQIVEGKNSSINR